jgi:ubiquinone/menaquinone biosynthesis C-methylase UbiE
MTTQTPDPIHEAVREHYGAIARSRGESSCCSPSATSSCCSPLYPAENLSELPASVTDLALGCGDPVSEADIRPGDTVLDLGSGGGIDCFLAARRTGPTGRVIGVDMTPEMLERSRQVATKLGLDNVEFREGIIETIPVEDGWADVVISNGVINLCPDKVAVCREVARVLRPGGRMTVADICVEKPVPEEALHDIDLWTG